MFLTKRLTAIACVWALAGAPAHAQQNKPAVPGTRPVSARAPAVDIDMGSPSKAGSAAVKAAPVASQPVAPQPVSASTPGTPHLSIDDIDQITRSKIARQLAGEGGQQGSVVALNAPARLTHHGLSHGIALYNRRANKGEFGDFQMIAPPLTATDQELDELVDLLGRALQDLHAELHAQGHVK